MMLSVLAAQYVAHKQSMGMRFHTEARTLQSFCRTMGDILVAEIAVDRVQAFIAGAGPVTRFWHRKHEVLRGFYRFAMARGYAASSSSQDHSQTTHLFLHLRRKKYRDCSTPLPVMMSRTANCSPTPSHALLLLYGAACIGEAPRWPMDLLLAS